MNQYGSCCLKTYRNASFRFFVALMPALAIIAASGCGTKQNVQEVRDRPAEQKQQQQPIAPTHPKHDPNETGIAMMGAQTQVACNGATVTVSQGADDPGKAIAADPIAFLKDCVARAKSLNSYTCTFIRQERLGMFKKLMPVEVMAADYRAEPLSVRLTWTDPESEFMQCAYVAGRDDGKVQTLPRKGLLGAKPNVEKYDPSLGVTFGKTRNLITDFGSTRMAERLVERIEKAKALGGVKCTYRGEAPVGPNNEQCYLVEMRFPDKDEFPNKLLDLYICKKKLVPIATYMYLPGTPERCEKTLDASYVYAGISPQATVTDSHFEIDALSKDEAAASDTAKDAKTGDDKSVRATDRSNG